MGLFGGKLKGLFGGGNDGGAGLAAASAYLNGDYAGGARLGMAARDYKNEAKKEEAKRQALAQVHAQIDADAGLSPQDKVYAKANPDAYVEQYMKRFGQVEMGPNGGSVGLRNAQGGMDWQRAPARYEIGRNLIDVDQQGKTNTVYEGVEPFSQPVGTRMHFLRGNGLVAEDGGTIPLGGPPASAPTYAETRGGTPNEMAKAALRANPSLAADFDEKYGPGAAAQVLGQGSGDPARRFLGQGGAGLGGPRPFR